MPPSRSAEESFKKFIDPYPHWDMTVEFNCFFFVCRCFCCKNFYEDLIVVREVTDRQTDRQTNAR